MRTFCSNEFLSEGAIRRIVSLIDMCKLSFQYVGNNKAQLASALRNCERDPLPGSNDSKRNVTKFFVVISLNQMREQRREGAELC